MRSCMGKCGDFCEILPLPKASPIYGRLRKGGRCPVLCGTSPSRTLSYASDRMLIRLNTCGLLKRAALERKKSAGGRNARFTHLLH